VNAAILAKLEVCVIGYGEAMPLHEIVLPETKPETEWVRGRPLQKVSPQRTHSLLQGALTAQLRQWAQARGEVGPEWRFRLAPPGQIRRPLVPDVAYISNERLRPLSDAEIEMPPVAPEVAVEVLSLGDRRVDVDDKIATYLGAGTLLVMLVDPLERIVEMHDASCEAWLGEDALIEHAALPGFRYPVRDLFAVLQRAR
jgi:Uma2 family endonuclease